MTPDVIAETDVREKPTNVAAHNSEKTGRSRRTEIANERGEFAMG
jgi:hypothetical protein